MIPIIDYVAFLLGAVIVLVPCVIAISRKPKDYSSSPTQIQLPTWNASDYQSNNDYYDKLTGIYDFNRTHNLRLDRLSSPCFDPIDGRCIRDQQFYWIDKKTIPFLSNGGSSNLVQLFRLILPDEIKNLNNYLEPIQLTFYPLDFDNLLFNRQGTRLVFSSQVYSN
ncbi:unnamed protein product [Rotaria magnacalcarata]|uniref:Uncharacterized protein n=1 Tax=Rotaria magnacalcarata TaxID=392030 RepID=A0A8S2K4V0_9BILA|nr:unnamed protein product [Rotaria magnacalcarata]